MINFLGIDFKGVPAVGRLKFSMAQKKVQKSASWGKSQLGDKGQFGDKI